MKEAPDRDGGLRFGIDGYCFSEHHQANSVRHFVSQTLGELPIMERGGHGVCFLKPDAEIPGALTGSPLEWQRLQGRLFSWRHISLPKALYRSSLDVAWFPFLTVPLYLPVPSVVTIHDISFEVLHEQFSRKARIYLGTMLRRALAQAARIVTISQFTADELQRVFGVASDRMAVIHHGVSDPGPTLDHSTEVAILEKLGVRSPYFLFLDGANPRKNLNLLLQTLRASANDLPRNQQFLVTGNVEDVRRTIVAGGCGHLLNGTFLLPGLLPEQELSTAYRHAEALLYLSLYEGFGLPILEAYSRKCPLVALRATSLPEVAGQGALFVEPGDFTGLARALVAVNDPATRAAMIQKGMNEIRRFSWSRSAARLYDVLAEVASHR